MEIIPTINEPYTQYGMPVADFYPEPAMVATRREKTASVNTQICNQKDYMGLKTQRILSFGTYLATKAQGSMAALFPASKIQQGAAIHKDVLNGIKQ